MKYLVQLNLWLGGTWKSLTWLDFAHVDKSYFPIVIHVHFYMLLCCFDGRSFKVNIIVICWLYAWFYDMF